MRSTIKKRSTLLLAAIWLGAGFALPLRAGEPQATPALGIWDDPEFQKQFLGSYGFQAEIEPRVTAVEREQLEQLLPLLGSDAGAAAVQLDKLATPSASAVFDFTLGNVYFQQERLDRAAEHYRTAVFKFPSYRRAHKNLALIHVRKGEFAEAVTELSRVIELGGNDGLTFGLLGYAQASLEQYVAAESAYRSAMMLQADMLDWKLGLTQTLLKQQKYGEAATLCEELIARYPERAELWLLQANAYIGMGKPLDAAQDYEILRRMGQATLQSLNVLGDIYVNEGLWDLAGGAYGEALDADPQQSLDRPLRAVEVLAQRGALTQAKTLLERVERSRGGNLEDPARIKLLKLAARIAVAEGTGGNAVDVLEQVVALDPLDGEALMLLGQHYAGADDADRAIFYYERAESLGEFAAEANVRHAQLLVSQSRYAEALPLLKRAQELKPRDDVARYLDQVERAARARS